MHAGIDKLAGRVRKRYAIVLTAPDRVRFFV
jgi:hypothetical protein